MTCEGCTGGCPCASEPLPNDARFYEHRVTKGGCEVMDCHLGADANTYWVTVRGPDGRQRTRAGCVVHLGLMASSCLSAVRLEPFE